MDVVTDGVGQCAPREITRYGSRLRAQPRTRPGRRARAVATHSIVIARLDRAIQYAAASRSHREASGILDPRFRGDDELWELRQWSTSTAKPSLPAS